MEVISIKHFVKHL